MNTEMMMGYLRFAWQLRPVVKEVLQKLYELTRGDPAKAADHNASLALLDGALAHLNARDRAILKLRYSESKPFHEIGQMMGLSESRVCQLHKRILSLLRREMTAQLEDEARGPIWFFTAKDVDLVKDMGSAAPAMLLFTSKGHDLFASVEGTLVLADDRATIDRLWSPFAAAWYEEGKDDPKLQLIRFDPGAAQIWLNENSVFAGVKMLLGVDPKKDYADKIAEVRLN